MVSFIIQETGCNKQFNDLEVGRGSVEVGMQEGGVGLGGRVDGWIDRWMEEEQVAKLPPV